MKLDYCLSGPEVKNKKCNGVLKGTAVDRFFKDLNIVKQYNSNSVYDM